MTKAKEALWAIVGHVTLSLIPESFTAVCFGIAHHRRILGHGQNHGLLLRRPRSFDGIETGETLQRLVQQQSLVPERFTSSVLRRSLLGKRGALCGVSPAVFIRVEGQRCTLNVRGVLYLLQNGSSVNKVFDAKSLVRGEQRFLGDEFLRQ